MNLKRFFVYSIGVHILLIAAILYLFPAPEERKEGGAFFTDLISPEELAPRRPPSPPPTRFAPPSRPGSPAAVPPAGPSRREKTVKERPQADRERMQPGTEDTGTAVPFAGAIRKGSGGSPGGPPGSPANKGAVGKSERNAPTMKELLDEKVIGDLAMRDIRKEEKKRNTFTFDANEYKFLIYNRRLKERIESIWRYPPEAAAKGIYGDLVIKFTIKKNGRLGAVELVRTSGHKDLDDAAMEALREGAPYWPLPDEWGMEGYTIEGHFIYTLYGFYIR